MLAHAAAIAPREACGLLWGAGARIDRAEPAANVSDQPERAFEIDPATLLAAQRLARRGGAGVAGWYHSHPSGSVEPSARDAEGASREPGRVWVIVADGRAAAWQACPGGPVLGAFQPLTLRAA
jgi:proteasome lid subunit RPN8/RPN11